MNISGYFLKRISEVIKNQDETKIVENRRFTGVLRF